MDNAIPEWAKVHQDMPVAINNPEKDEEEKPTDEIKRQSQDVNWWGGGKKK